MLVFGPDQLRIAETALVERLEDPLLRYLVERHRRAAGDDGRPLLHDLAKGVLIVGSVTR